MQMKKAIPILAALLALMSGCHSTGELAPKASKLSQAQIPENDPEWRAILALTLVHKAPVEGTTGLGQVFLAPKKHDFLTRVGFLLRPYPAHEGEQPQTADMQLNLRISAWHGDRPAPAALWESRPITLKGNFNEGWTYFEIPHVKLEQDKKYIAWLSFAGLSNPERAALTVITMGPATYGTAMPTNPKESWQPALWMVHYSPGTRAFWRGKNPHGAVDMTASAWRSAGPGQNLHFKMTFADVAQ